MMLQYQSTALGSLGSIFAVIAMIGWFYVFYRVYKNYKESQKQQSLYFSIALAMGGIAILFLAAEQIILTFFDEGTTYGARYLGGDIIAGSLSAYNLALFFAFIAASVSVISLLFFNLFSLSFFENKLKLIIIPVILLIGYIVVFIFISNPEWRLNMTGTDWDLHREDAMELLIISLFIIPIVFPLLVFYYTTWIVRGNTFNFRRLFFLSLFQTALFFAYYIEIIGAEDALIVFTRFLLMIYPFLTWATLNPGDRVKRLLGASA